MTLALDIEAVIHRARADGFLNEFTPLKKMIGASPFIDRRIRHLADHLADAFLQYVKYGGKFLKQWSKEEGWQQSIWHQTMAKRGVLYDDLIDLKFPKQNTHSYLHFFGLSFIPDLFFECFNHAATIVSLNYYAISPCQIFWGDAISDRLRLQSQDLISATHHPLLTNWGMIGKIFPEQIERHHYNTKEIYPTSIPKTLLEHLQASIISGDTTRTSIGKSTCDSIQIHQASSKLREIEILKDALIDLAKNHQIQPNEILVLAPSISEYVPFIQMIFGSSRCPFNAAISDVTSFSDSLFLQGLVSLVDLATNRFEVDEILDFFNNPCVVRESKIKPEDMRLLAQIADIGGVRWGLNSQHRQMRLSMPGYPAEMVEKSSFGTWEFAFDGYLMGLAVINQEELPSEVVPLDVVDIAQAESLGQWIAVLNSLREDLKPIMERKSLDCDSWTQLLNHLAETYFDLTQDEKGYALFQRALSQIDSHEDLYCFDSIWERLKQELTNTISPGVQCDLNAIQFCSLKTGRARPAKLIWCLGLHEGAYPRLAKKNPCNQLDKSPLKDPYPSHAEEDRYLMLELLLSARHTIAFSYLNRSEEDGKVQGPSLLINELLGTLSTQAKTVHHSVVPFDQRYFEQEGTFSSYDSEMFSMAKQVYIDKNIVKSHVFPQFFSQQIQKPPQKQVEEVDIGDLFRFAQHPLRYFFTRKLNVYLERNDRQIDKEFEMSALDAFLLKKSLLLTTIDTGVHPQRLGKGPLGRFGDIAWNKLSQEIQEHHKAATIFGLSSSDLYTIQLDKSDVKQFYMKNTHHIFPPISIQLSTGSRVNLKGKIDSLSDQGLVIMEKDQLEQRVKIWPLALICAKLSQEHGIWPSTLLWTGDGTKLDLNFECIDSALRNYLEYFLDAEQDPSPLLPNWAESFLRNDTSQLRYVIARSLQSEDPYVKWAFSCDEQFDVDVINDRWSGHYHRLLEEISTQ